MTDTNKTALPTGRFDVQAAAEKTGRVVQDTLKRVRQDTLDSAETGKAEAATFLNDSAAEATKHMTAMTKSYADLSSAIIAMQHACFESMTRAFGGNGKSKPQDIFTCRTLADVTELQQALYKDALENIAQLNAKLTELVTHMTSDDTKLALQTAAGR